MFDRMICFRPKSLHSALIFETQAMIQIELIVFLLLIFVST